MTMAFLTDPIQIRKCLADNFDVINSHNRLRPGIVTIDNAGIVAIEGSLKLKISTLETLPVQFGTVTESCDFSYAKLTSLAGAPQFVGGEFRCDNCNHLKTLEGGPLTVNGMYNCSNCESLTTLTGAATSVGAFNCSWCPQLRDLKGSPQIIFRRGRFICDNCHLLQTLEGAPTLTGDFSCFACKSLTTLLGAPTRVTDFECSDCTQLTSLRYAPTHIDGAFNAKACEMLTELEWQIETAVGKICLQRCGNLQNIKGTLPAGKNLFCDSNYQMDLLVNSPKLTLLVKPQFLKQPTAEAFRALVQYETKIQGFGIDSEPPPRWLDALRAYQKSNDLLQLANTFMELYGEPLVVQQAEQPEPINLTIENF